MKGHLLQRRHLHALLMNVLGFPDGSCVAGRFVGRPGSPAENSCPPFFTVYIHLKIIGDNGILRRGAVQRVRQSLKILFFEQGKNFLIVKRIADDLVRPIFCAPQADIVTIGGDIVYSN